MTLGLKFALFIKRRVRHQVSSRFLEAAQVLLQAMVSDKSPRRLMTKYCLILYIATLVNSVLGLIWGHMIVLHLALGQTLSSALPCSSPTSYWSDLGTSTHETAMDRTLRIVRSCWTKKRNGFPFLCLDIPLCQNGLWCQQHKFVQKKHLLYQY